MSGPQKITPAVAQWLELKERHKDCILFFRLGDFYETFGDDALTASKELDIVLTKRAFSPEDKPFPMAGVPYHAYESYAARLLKKGYKIAICEQMEDPAVAKGPVVRREIVRILTPGTVMEDQFIEGRGSNRLASIVKGSGFGVAFLDVSTGEFTVSHLTKREDVATELLRNSPREVISTTVELDELVVGTIRAKVRRAEPMGIDDAKRRVASHFGVAAVEGIGLDTEENVMAVAQSLRYAKDECMLRLDHVRTVRSYSPSEFMVLDATTLRNLEVVRSLREGTGEGTLLSLMDRCSTAMGSRLQVNWLTQPLKDTDAISERLDAVEGLVGSGGMRDAVRELMRGTKDIDRLASRVGYGSASPRDLLALRDALERAPRLKSALSGSRSVLVLRAMSDMGDLGELTGAISRGIDESAPPKADAGFIKAGYSKEIDELRRMTSDTRDWLSRMEETERQKTGIRSLKIGFNKVFGYYIEVSKANLDRVPPYYIRKQTTVNAERFITPELKEVEERVAHAEEELRRLEARALEEIIDIARRNLAAISRCSNAMALVDVLCSFASVASDYGYCRPEVNRSQRITIKNGRHPVVERMVTAFVPNDADIDAEEHRVMIITGPNMAGKSTFMRQIALIVSMAQSGSFVPAEYASIGVVDRIFTRVGAFDDLVRGQSTFMTEMVEVASILHSATKDSLILLDEIGRGTSTYDGLSIAWAVVEHIADRRKCGARAMVATHYHQLTQVASKLKGVGNYQIAVKEEGGDIIFLRKVVPGSTDKSYGIHVARLAGLPAPVVESAKRVLANIESQDSIAIGKEGGGRKVVPTQLMFLPADEPARPEEEHEALKHLRSVDPDRMTPMEALALIARLKKMVHEGDGI